MGNETSDKFNSKVFARNFQLLKCNKIKVFKQILGTIQLHLPLIQFSDVGFCTFNNVKCGCFHYNAFIICSKLVTFI